MQTLMHTWRTEQLQERLEQWGEERTVQQVDQSIQNACESFRDREGHWPNLDNDETWDFVVYGAVESLDIDHDLVGL